MFEQHAKQDAENFGLLRDDVADVKADVVAARSEIAELKLELTKYKGMVGGVMLLGSAIATFIGFVAAIVIEHFWK
jgi:hypothetical protein